MGHKGCAWPRLRSPAKPKARRPESRLPRPALQDPAPARARGGLRRQRRRPRGTLGARPRHTRSSALSGPSPAPSGARDLQLQQATSPPEEPTKARVCKGAGARRGEGRRNSRSSWPRPCRRSAPPAPPAGLSAPVARGPPSSRAGSGRARRPGRPEGLRGRLRRGWSPCAGGTDPRSERLRRRRWRRRGCGSSCDRGTGREAAATAVRAAGGQPPAAPPTPRDATAPPTRPRTPAPALPFLGFPLPNSARRRSLGVPSFPAAPQRAGCFPSPRLLCPIFSRRPPPFVLQTAALSGLRRLGPWEL